MGGREKKVGSKAMDVGGRGVDGPAAGPSGRDHPGLCPAGRAALEWCPFARDLLDRVGPAEAARRLYVEAPGPHGPLDAVPLPLASLSAGLLSGVGHGGMTTGLPRLSLRRRGSAARAALFADGGGGAGAGAGAGGAPPTGGGGSGGGGDGGGEADGDPPRAPPVTASALVAAASVSGAAAGRCPLRAMADPARAALARLSSSIAFLAPVAADGGLRCPPAVVAARAAVSGSTLAKALRKRELLGRLGAVAAIALVINLPLGALRYHTTKFGWEWALAVHGSVPFVSLWRRAAMIPLWGLPCTVGGAVLGQALGAHAERERLALEAALAAGGAGSVGSSGASGSWGLASPRLK